MWGSLAGPPMVKRPPSIDTQLSNTVKFFTWVIVFVVCARLAVVGELSALRKDKKCGVAFFSTLVVSALCKCP